jgi:hypothetical protein
MTSLLWDGPSPVRGFHPGARVLGWLSHRCTSGGYPCGGFFLITNADEMVASSLPSGVRGSRSPLRYSRFRASILATPRRSDLARMDHVEALILVRPVVASLDVMYFRYLRWSNYGLAAIAQFILATPAILVGAFTGAVGHLVRRRGRHVASREATEVK